MAQKWPKIAIFGPKMLQMTCNLDIWCILMIFIDFQIFFNFYRKLPDFWAKNTNFFADAAKIWENDFQRKVYAFFQKWSNRPNLW